MLAPDIQFVEGIKALDATQELIPDSLGFLHPELDLPNNFRFYAGYVDTNPATAAIINLTFGQGGQLGSKARIGNLATSQQHGLGLDKEFLEFVLSSLATKPPLHEVDFRMPVREFEFFRDLGFVPVGKAFTGMPDGKEYIRMSKTLKN